METMDQLLVARVNYKKTVILITTQRSYFAEQIVLIFSLIRTVNRQSNFFNFQSNQDNFFVKHIKFRNRKEL